LSGWGNAKSELQEDSRELFLPFFGLLPPARTDYHFIATLEEKSKRSVFTLHSFFTVIKKPGPFNDVHSVVIMAVGWLREVPGEFGWMASLLYSNVI
jgi:hypothetical protein